jgi:hypothetical protein
MSIDVRWENDEHTLVLWTFPPQWTWEDFFKAKEVSDGMVRDLPYVVDIIGNLTRSSVLPKGAIGTYSSSTKSSPKNTGIIVLVGTNAFVKLMVGTFSKLIPFGVPGASFLFADTVEGAKDLIAARRTVSA